MIKKILMIFVSGIHIIGYAGDSADEKMETYSRILYNQAISKSKYCDALLVAKRRFDYIDDNKTSFLQIQSRIKDWKDLEKNVELDCRKEKWPAQEAEYKEILNSLKFQVDLYKKINIEMKISNPKKDSWKRSCVRELIVSNKTNYVLNSFSAEFFSNNREGIITWSARSRQPKFKFAAIQQREEDLVEIKPIKGGEVREIDVCKFFDLDDRIIKMNKVVKSIHNEMQGDYIKLELNEVTVLTEQGLKSIKFSHSRIEDLLDTIKKIEYALKNNNPFN